MPFPVIAATPTGTNGNAATSSPVVDLPANIAAGDLLLVLIRTAVGGSIGWPDGNWIELFDASSDDADDQMALAWRKADGGEGATVTLSSTSSKFAALSWRITGAKDPNIQPPELSTVAVGTSTTPDPTTCTPTGGAKDYLWIWLGGWEGEQTSPPASNPTDYADNVAGANSGSGGAITTNVRVATASRSLNAASQDPGSWTISASDNWTAYALAVHPDEITMDRWFTAAVARQHNFPPEMGVFNTN